jgi:hypothetical protein
VPIKPLANVPLTPAETVRARPAAADRLSGPGQGEVAPPWGFAELFLISQTLFPALLFLPGMQMIRLPCRIAVYLLSLGALAYGWSAWASRRLPPHPACRPLLFFTAWIGVSVANPYVNSHLAAIAQLMLYVSVFAPVFWAPQQVRGERQLARLLWILLVCNGLNSCVGLLQVYDPERWQPAEYSATVRNFEFGMAGNMYRGADGREIVRPCGLFDTPGAVCGPAAIAFLVGLSLALTPGTSLPARLLAVALGFCGLTAIWFTHVRTLLLIGIGMVVVRVAYLTLYRRVAEATLLGGVAWLTFTASFAVAVSVGGTAVLERFATLTEDRPEEVYYKAYRGQQLEYGLVELPAQYPLGAGPGRWGMMYVYFGDRLNTENRAMWAELAIPGWVLDGGIPGLLFYVWALAVTVRHDFRLAQVARLRKTVPLATIIMAVSAGTYALIFGFTPFTNQVGMQFWFLVGALHGVYSRYGRAADAAATVPAKSRARDGRRFLEFPPREDHGPAPTKR